MSRIVRPRVEDGDSIDATDLNNRFQDYNQTNLNQFNHRDAAHDLPQMSNTDWMCSYSNEITIGKVDVFHAAPVTIAGQTAMPAAPVPIGDGVNTTPMDFGALGITVDNDEVLRVYWNLSVNPTFAGTPWRGGSSISHYTFPDTTGGTTLLATDVTCWILYLEWDITSSALTNWVPVPDQQDYTNNITGTVYGDKLEDSMSVVPIPAWTERANSAQNGQVLPGGRVVNRTGWCGVSGTYYFAPGNFNRTIYGLRVVAKGLMHSYNTGNINYLVHDQFASSGAELEYTCGRLSVIKHTLG